MNVLLILAIGLTSLAGSPAPPQSTVLGVGSPVDRSIAAGESHTFDLRLDAGQTALVEIEERGIDVNLKVTEPNGDTIAQVIDLFGGQGRGQMIVAADTAGPFVLTVSARPWPIASGSYTLGLTGVRPSTASDRELLRAMRLRADDRARRRRRQPRLGDRAGGRGPGGRRARSEPFRQRSGALHLRPRAPVPHRGRAAEGMAAVRAESVPPRTIGRSRPSPCGARAFCHSARS